MQNTPETQKRSPRDTVIFALSAVLVVAALVIFVAQRDTGVQEQVAHVDDRGDDDAQEGDAPQVDLEELKSRMIGNPDLILVDVQERDGYLAQHIPGSINIPFEELIDRQAEIPKNREVVISCIGNDVLPCALSTKAGRELGGEGYQNLLDYRGGVAEWKDAGLPVITNQEILVRATSVDELHTMIQDREDVVVLDVRDQESFMEGHIPTATRVEFTDLKEELVRIPKHKDVLVYDDAGNRSKLFVDELVRNGYILVSDIVDGYNAWTARGYDIEN